MCSSHESKMEITDIAGLSQPLSKLVDVVSSAIGTIYRPKAIRDEADAQAYAQKALARAEAESVIESRQLQFSYALNKVHEALQDHPQLAARARQRLLTREIEGQLNVESIADFATEALPPVVSDEAISADWRRKFFQEAENICEADMQLLWGKVLAGEVTFPGTYSTRTLDTLRQLSRTEAELFRRACAVAMSEGWIAIPNGDLNRDLQPFGLAYSDILSLRDAGLLLDGDQIHKDFSRTEHHVADGIRPVVLFNNGVLIELSGVPVATLRLPALIFSRAGKELQRLNDHSETPDYLSSLGRALRARGLTVKRGTQIPQEDGMVVVVFEQDL